MKKDKISLFAIVKGITHLEKVECVSTHQEIEISPMEREIFQCENGSSNIRKMREGKEVRNLRELPSLKFVNSAPKEKRASLTNFSLPQGRQSVRVAFTLAEVLITLGIIGVVAAMTLPTLIQNYQEKALVNQLKVAYSLLSQAHMNVLKEYGPMEHLDLGQTCTATGAEKLYNFYKPFLKVSQDCGRNSGCFYSGTYKALFNNTWAWQPNTHSVYARAKLQNGMSVAFWSNGTGCSNDSCGNINVDINGEKGPNQAGVDYFNFEIRTNRIVPNDSILSVDSYGNKCKYNDTSNTNGLFCTAWVISRENMDYRRRDISNEWTGTP